ncbi:unnamed protein product [Urochloa decumbens]|uniref:F-box associated beta-propeller type 3 domain-containing protein n=1 Tax=Urochloa decumbens TaxID=240449 RepID=A0ABC9E5A7_9POAL
MGKGAQGRPRRKRSAVPGTPDTKRRKRGSNDGAGFLCDDVVGNILARLPARTAVACTALSKRHRRLIRSTEFRSLHFRLAPPPPPLPHQPRPHIDFLVTAPIKRRPDQKVPVSGFVSFHVAGAELSSITPMRSVAGRRFLRLSYVNACNGVVLLATGGYSARCRCILWNPAVADVVEEVTVPDPSPRSTSLVIGLGYGQRSKTYKLLVLCRSEDGEDSTAEYSLQTYALGVVEKKPKELITGWTGRKSGGMIGQEDSLYIDGKIYLLDRKNAIILAFDVDEEGITSIIVPVKNHPDGPIYTVSKLMEMSGRPCVLGYHGRDCALWVLSGDHHWEQRFFISRELQDPDCIHLASIKGVWNCGGVLVLYLDDIHDVHNLFVYDVTIQKMFKAKMHQDLAPPRRSQFLDYALCWGYKATLVSPSSIIISKPNQDKQERCQKCSTDIMKALKPVVEQDKRKGQEVTLGTVCFMDFLVRIMHKLPKELQQVLEMTMVDSDGPDFSFENVPFADSDL